MSKEIVLTNESVNCYGYVTLTDGIDLEQYQKNPIILFMHTRPLGGFSGQGPMPIGMMDNLRRDGDKLIGTPVFDEEDEFACKIKSKFERGFIRMASIGISITGIDDDPKNWKPGQTRPTVTHCKLTEVSIVDIGANDDALAIDQSAELKIGDYVTLRYPPMNNDQLAMDNLNELKNPLKMKQEQDHKSIATLVASVLGIAEDASEEELIRELKHTKAKADMTDALMAEAEKQRDQEIASLVNDAINDGRISKENVETYTSIGTTLSIEALKTVLAAYPKKEETKAESLSAMLKAENTKETDADDWDSLFRAGKLEQLKKDNPAKFDELLKKKFGK